MKDTRELIIAALKEKYPGIVIDGDTVLYDGQNIGLNLSDAMSHAKTAMEKFNNALIPLMAKKRTVASKAAKFDAMRLGPGTLVNTAVISRNAPCPCGSGKKWKKCGRLKLCGQVNEIPDHIRLVQSSEMKMERHTNKEPLRGEIVNRDTITVAPAA